MNDPIKTSVEAAKQAILNRDSIRQDLVSELEKLATGPSLLPPEILELLAAHRAAMSDCRVAAADLDRVGQTLNTYVRAKRAA